MRNKTPWWLNYRKRLYNKREYLNIEMIIRKSFCETFKEYTENCSVGGIKQIRLSDNSRFQRLLWIIVVLVAFGAVLGFLRVTWKTTLAAPLILNTESVTYPISDLNFPAVTLCNFNRISNKSLVEYAREIYMRYKHKTNNTLRESMMYNYFKDFGRLIDYRYDASVQGLVNHASLSKYILKVESIMRRLAPNCDEMLIRCMWAGNVVNCSDIFVTRQTGLGHCCVFNYLVNLNSSDTAYKTTEPVKKQEVAGLTNGLLVLADPLIEDYAYSISNGFGFQVLLHDPLQYPDQNIGRSLHRMAEPNYAKFFQIRSIQQYATNEVRKYSRKTRNCLFKNELKSIYKDTYSYGLCLVRCRMEALRSLCRCVPYFYTSGIHKNVNHCTIKHLRCLNKYKEKLIYLYPRHAQDTTGLETELVDSLSCPDCLPDCQLTRHFTKEFRINLARISQDGLKPPLLMGVNLTNKCLIGVYRSESVGVLHRLDVVAYWFEILSNIGGFSGMVMGIGCYTFVEILYYVIVRFFRRIYINYIKYH